MVFNQVNKNGEQKGKKGWEKNSGRLRRPTHQNSNVENGLLTQRLHTRSIAAEATNEKDKCTYIVHVT